MSAIELASFTNIKAPSSKVTTHSVDSTEEVLSSLTPELVIALCGPIGSPLHESADEFSNALLAFGYKTQKIRLSEIIYENASLVDISIPDSASRFEKINLLIAAGDELRNRYGNDVLSKFAIAKIKADREASFGAFKDAAAESHAPDGQRISQQRVCHIIDSVKNNAELELLRHVYGDALLAVGIFPHWKSG